MQTEKDRLSSLPLLAITLFAGIVLFHLANALTDRSFFRASHLGAALEYARGSINLLKPVMTGFNANGTPAALEFPLWQAAVALAFKAAHSTWFGWANLISLFFFATGLWPLFQLARQYVGERAAWWSMVFFLTQPLIIVMAGEASTDGFCIVAMLWFLFCADRLIRTKRISWWLPTVFFAALSAVTKLPFFMTAGLCGIFMLINVRSLRAWILLGSAGGVAAIIFFAWSHYADSLSAQALYPYQELRLSKNPNMVFWFFGDLHYRLNPANWIKGGWRFLHATLGALPMFLLLAAALLRPGNRMPKAWLIATLLTTLVFTHLVLEHWHYYLMCCPAVAMLCGATLARWEIFWAQEMPRPCLQLALSGLILIFSAVDGIVAMKVSLLYDPFKKNLAAVIHEQTKPADKLVIFDPDDWGGEILFRSERNGLCVFSLENPQGVSTAKGLTELLTNEEDLHRLKALGYNKLVLLGESPVRYAVEAANPNSHKVRRHFPESISLNVDAWPVVYHSEDMLIQEIP